MMKRLILSTLAASVGVFALVNVTAQSPLTIHGHPQKAIYSNPSEWVPASGQCHWFDTLRPGVVMHTHVEGALPLYAEHDGKSLLVIPVTLVLFHVDGFIDQVWSDLGFFTWDVNNAWAWAPPDGRGDPTGIVTVHGKFYLDISRGGTDNASGPHTFSPHGWSAVQWSVRTQFADGSNTTTELLFSLWSMVHPEAPILLASEGDAKFLRTDCLTAVRGHVPYGIVLGEFRDYVPIAPLPLGTIWNVPFLGYNYAGDPGEPDGVADQRLDPDLHHGVIGTQLSGPGFDTNASGLGLHTFSFKWDVKGNGTPNFPAGEDTTALLNVKVIVGDGTVVTPPPPPPPPPPPVSPWETLVQSPLWVGRCIDPTGTQCKPFHLVAVCVPTNPVACEWTKLILP